MFSWLITISLHRRRKKNMKKVGLQNRFFIAFLEFLGDLIFSRKFFEIYSPPVTMHTTQCHAFEPTVTAREPHQRNVCEYLHSRDIVHRDSTPANNDFRMSPGSLKKIKKNTFFNAVLRFPATSKKKKNSCFFLKFDHNKPAAIR